VWQPAAPPRFTAPETYTPQHLAEKIFAARSDLEGECKQATVLFADIEAALVQVSGAGVAGRA